MECVKYKHSRSLVVIDTQHVACGRHGLSKFTDVIVVACEAAVRCLFGLMAVGAYSLLHGFEVTCEGGWIAILKTN